MNLATRETILQGLWERAGLVVDLFHLGSQLPQKEAVDHAVEQLSEYMEEHAEEVEE